MKLVILLLICLALGCQGNVLRTPKDAIDVPVEIQFGPEYLADIEKQAQKQAEAQTEQKPAKVTEQKPAEETEQKAEKKTGKEASEEALIDLEYLAKEEAKQKLKKEKETEREPAKQKEAEKVAKELTRTGEQEETEVTTESKAQQLMEDIRIYDDKPAIKPEDLKPDATATEPKTELPKIAEEQPTEAQAEPQSEPQTLLKSLADEQTSAEVAAAPAVPAEPVAEEQDAVQPNLRQATQATPTQQSSTQQNFVQQLIQNSPIGQFLNQFNGNQQQQAQPTADQAATPVPTVPGFLNPSNAITSVQNAAQSVVNTTTQAFQGIQQFASNLGTQFQNTLSGLTGQQQQATTPRPPGPIQSFVNNVFGGGNNNATAAAQPQQQGPLQGIINFLGGGNRPQNPAPAAAEAAAPAPVVTDAPARQPGVNDKIEQAEDSVEQAADTENEVRNSGEAVDDSFEEAVPVNEIIVVNDDASASDVTAAEPGQAVVNNSVEQESQPAADPAAL
ncbi:20-hydroxyecdysone protein [Drosophila grimshawi]|uniref:GH15050 n=1 Tax=Drosophila grimshawi TaxID=7222 RepID=B4IZU9_DROGR|nr:20-hydroxyecdysone protein [Drosophila grimshawi]EDV96721.1 GH15050 [Drosophila grimshawi]